MRKRSPFRFYVGTHCPVYRRTMVASVGRPLFCWDEVLARISLHHNYSFAISVLSNTTKNYENSETLREPSVRTDIRNKKKH
ncbi:hypothetical protein PUN28_003749 [Cardiocondyla obscurior]|uniref:Uncharacterized protein n=1 Tax=Cardiocondyla obscurior TaxID=286306 RepID=A0AAW2GNG7_9HYME